MNSNNKTSLERFENYIRKRLAGGPCEVDVSVARYTSGQGHYVRTMINGMAMPGIPCEHFIQMDLDLEARNLVLDAERMRLVRSA